MKTGILTLALLCAVPALAQTPSPWKVTYSPSPDHTTVDNSGAGLVTKYELTVTNGTVTVKQDLGKPTCTSTCVVDVNATILPLPAGNYTASVVAIGPGGTSAPATSSPFTLQGPTRVPAPPGTVSVGRS